MKTNLEIEYLPLKKLKMYKRNARKHDIGDLQVIKNSITEFGFDDPIGIWGKDNTIVEGHGRYLAAKELGFDEVPVIRLDHLSDEQRKAYALVHNRSAELSSWDEPILSKELLDLEDIDLDDLGFNLDFIDEIGQDNLDEDVERENAGELDPSCQHNVFENMEKAQYEQVNYYGIPEISATQTTGDRMLRFCDHKETTLEERKNLIAHFYYDDYKFMSAWRNPDKYLEKLAEFKAVVAPNFSLYTDFPRVLQILSCYRRNWTAKYWQEKGIDVIPQVVWGDKESYNYCFDGIPKGSVVSVSTLGIMEDDDWNGESGEMFKEGYKEMLNRLEPTTILLYGALQNGLEGNIIRIPTYYEEKFKNKKG